MAVDDAKCLLRLLVFLETQGDVRFESGAGEEQFLTGYSRTGNVTVVDDVGSLDAAEEAGSVDFDPIVVKAESSAIIEGAGCRNEFLCRVSSPFFFSMAFAFMITPRPATS